MTPDRLRPGLRLLFCGYNPSLRSGASGHHYAHPGNRFWRVLHAAGITERLYLPEEDDRLLDMGIGFTNLVARPTRRADELGRDEIRAGAAELQSKLETLLPRVVAYTGSGVYRWFRLGRQPGWGIQPAGVVEDVTEVVVPSPSGLNRMTFAQLVDQYRVLARLI
ncbi:MAG TPA: G/U mismatch-specific DNA glycosylase [Herpetosiphonaceae bacterium]|nr:G/U mismatch-specific DNA glycosylase [Herpetosiphonaceae bacterium]